MDGRKDFDRMVDVYIEIFGNRWNILIINELLIGSRRFNEIKRNLEPVTQTVLIRHLRQLEGYGIISREVIDGPVQEVRYTVTPQGIKLYEPMLGTFGWIIQNVIDKDKYESVDGDREYHNFRIQLSGQKMSGPTRI